MHFVVRCRWNDWLYLPRRWVGFAEGSDGDTFEVIQVDELEAIVKAAAIADFRTNPERGRKLQVHGSSGGKVLRQDRVETALADDEASPSQGQVRWRAGFHDSPHGAINPVSGEAPLLHASEHTLRRGLPRKSPKNMAAGFLRDGRCSCRRLRKGAYTETGNSHTDDLAPGPGKERV